MEENSWYRLGMAGIEKEDPYTALMGFDGAIVRKLQASNLSDALQLLEKFVGLLLEKTWFHEAKSLVESFAKGVKKSGVNKTAAEGLFTLGSHFIKESLDLSVLAFDLAAGLDRQSELPIRSRAGGLLLQISSENGEEQNLLLSEAAKNLILAQEFERGTEIYEKLLNEPEPQSLPQLLAYAALGRLIEKDIEGAAALINKHRKKKELAGPIRKDKRDRAYFDFTVESISALRSGDAFRYNTIKKAFLQVAGNTDSVMMAYIRKIQEYFPPVPSGLF
ncbi:MAG: hypothetical protein ACXADX_15710 [Candidatus Hodarchaeales archaeon]|jgi:hypothetical protein